MPLTDFDYELPKELIADRPPKTRGQSRLLVVDRKSGSINDLYFSDLARYINEGDALVLNDTKVYKARLLGKKIPTGGKVDFLLIEERQEIPSDLFGDHWSAAEADDIRQMKCWRILCQPTLKPGQRVLLCDGKTEALYLGKDREGISWAAFGPGVSVRTLIEEIGEVPLPPYIKRPSDKEDETRYQTIYAKEEGAVAAPTAGLHFTDEILNQIRERKANVEFVTLHVGYGTFKPVEDLENHRMHAESFSLEGPVALRLNQVKAQGHKVWAVGTTTLRVLETCVQDKLIVAGRGETDLYIREPFVFEAVDHLITNFHLPRTTLLLLVTAFMGRELWKKAYEHAIKERYHFYSYGDAMLIL